MKYMICEDFAGQPIPFLFPEKVDHADMREQLPYTKVLSVGYVALENGVFVCYGGDADMGLAAQEEDAACLTAFFTR